MGFQQQPISIVLAATATAKATTGIYQLHRCSFDNTRSTSYTGLQKLRAMSSSQRTNLTRWDDLRTSAGVAVLTKDSSVIQINGTRLAHILSIMPSSQFSNGERIPADSNIYLEAAGLLALHHFNERSGKILPQLPERLADCNVYLTMDMKDSMFSPIQASMYFYNAILKPNSLRHPSPVAVVGDYRSSSSIPLSILTGAYGKVQISSCSTSSALDNKDQSPTFVRTVPTNAVDTQAVVQFFKNHLNIRRFAVLFVRDDYGNQFARDLAAACDASNMTLIAVPHEDGNVQSTRNAMLEIKKSGLRYVFGVISGMPTSVKMIINEALNAGIMGNPEYAWFYGDGATTLMEPAFYQTVLNSMVEEDRNIARAISGSGVLLLNPTTNVQFEQAMVDMGNDKALLDYYISRHDNPATFDGFDFQSTPNPFQYFNFDAVMSLGIALCDSEAEFVTDDEMLHQLKGTQFDGVSGPVSFDPITGTRTSASAVFTITNVLVSIGANGFGVEPRTSAAIHLSTGNVDVISPFIFNGGSTDAPIELPAANENLNLVPIGIQAFVWVLSAMAILASIGFAAWTIRFRNTHVVRTSQPFFLLMLCLGTLLMGTCIIPMSLQEPVPVSGLNIACMAAPWLFVLGFGTASSSLLCKALRINHLYRTSLSMQRRNVSVRDVIYPFVFITGVNVILLICWTVIAPATWIRSDLDNFDRYGRSIESVGKCGYSEGGTQQIFVILLLLVNVIYTIIGNYQSYLTRKMPANFNEVPCIMLSMASILESFLIGIPIVVMSNDNPTADLTVRSILVFLLCLAILLPLFVSKIIAKQTKQSRANTMAAWNDTVRRHPISSSNGRRSAIGGNGSTVDEIRARVAMASENSERGTRTGD